MRVRSDGVLMICFVSPTSSPPTISTSKSIAALSICLVTSPLSRRRQSGWCVRPSTILVTPCARANSSIAATMSSDFSHTVSAPRSPARLMLSSSLTKSRVLIRPTASDGVSTCTAYHSASELPRDAAGLAQEHPAIVRIGGQSDHYPLGRQRAPRRLRAAAPRGPRAGGLRPRATSRSVTSRSDARLVGLKKFLSACSICAAG